MQKLDKSWNNKVSDWAGDSASLYLSGASDFQEKAIKALEKEKVRPCLPGASLCNTVIDSNIKIIKNLKSH